MTIDGPHDRQRPYADTTDDDESHHRQLYRVLRAYDAYVKPTMPMSIRRGHIKGWGRRSLSRPMHHAIENLRVRHQRDAGRGPPEVLHCYNSSRS